MLVYAWNHPHEKRLISVYDEDEKDLLNLLSKVLLVKVKALIKKGFYKEYVQSQEESGIIRGKVLFKEAMQSFSHKRGKMHIQYEEMSHDILHNQLIKATLLYLINQENIEKEYRAEIRKVLTYFEGITTIKVSSQLFNVINVHRNNQHYQFLLQVCQFIWENALLHEGDSEKQFQDFSRDHQQMAQLFENFVKNFYRKEIQGSKVRSESFYWPAEGEKIELLPSMKTDISLEFADQKVIMDTKFYKDMFGANWNKETIRSAHLYQLFAYLKNDEYYSGRKAKGILLYPKVYKTINLSYKIHGFDVKMCTVDLSQEWKRIHERLLEVVGLKLGSVGGEGDF
jgi:5-methylcytosine-specific restriction enzyme subunit McrC